MKVAFIGQKGIPMKFGGIEKHVESLSVGLAKKGFDVTVYTRPWYTAKTKKGYKGVKLISLKSFNTKHLDAISHTLFATIDAIRKDYDVIHYHGVGPSLLVWLPKLLKPRVKVVSTFHCIDRLHQKWNWFARFSLWLGEWTSIKFADETISISRTLQFYCSNKYGKDTTYVPNGVTVEKSNSAKLIKQKFGLEKDGYILFLSRLIPHKGTHYLIKSYNQLKTKKKLVIAGAPSYTEKYLAELKDLAKDNPNIIFTGNVQGGSDLWRELFSNAYLFVHPSEREGLPIAVLEAMSFGKGVLASSIPENIEAIGEDYGFTFENKNEIDLKGKLEFLLKNPALVKRVGNKAKAHVQKNYNWTDIVKSTENIYSNLHNESNVELLAKVKTT